MCITGTDPFKHLHHSLDIWHKAKKLAFLLGEIAKKAAKIYYRGFDQLHVLTIFGIAAVLPRGM